MKIGIDITIEDAWKDFQSNVIPPNAGHDQILDLRIAFFGGLFWMWEQLTTALPDDDNEGEIFMTDLEKQIRNWQAHYETLLNKPTEGNG